MALVKKISIEHILKYKNEKPSNPKEIKVMFQKIQEICFKSNYITNKDIVKKQDTCESSIKKTIISILNKISKDNFTVIVSSIYEIEIINKHIYNIITSSIYNSYIKNPYNPNIIQLIMYLIKDNKMNYRIDKEECVFFKTIINNCYNSYCKKENMINLIILLCELDKIHCIKGTVIESILIDLFKIIKSDKKEHVNLIYIKEILFRKPDLKKKYESHVRSISFDYKEKYRFIYADMLAEYGEMNNKNIINEPILQDNDFNERCAGIAKELINNRNYDETLEKINLNVEEYLYGIIINGLEFKIDEFKYIVNLVKRTNVNVIDIINRIELIKDDLLLDYPMIDKYLSMF